MFCRRSRLNIETLKQPSASTNPANQKGFIILDIDTSGLNIGIMLVSYVDELLPSDYDRCQDTKRAAFAELGKALLKSRLIPLFNTAFKARSSNNPFSVRWFLSLIKL